MSLVAANVRTDKSFRLASPIVEIKVLNGFNYKEVGEWCNAYFVEEVVRNGLTEIVMYVHTYDPAFGERGANNRLDVIKGVRSGTFTTYIAKLENGKFVLFDSITFDGAIEEMETE